MADFDDIIQEINENIPDNNTQSITAKKLRDTLVDLTDAIETQQSEFEDGIQTQQSDFETNITNRQEAFENDVDEQLSSINTQFATGQNIGDVGIDDEPTAGSNNLVKSGGVAGLIDTTHLVNPTDKSLSKAEDVMQLKAKLEGVTASEVKAMVGEQISGYINGNGVPTAVSSGSTTTYVVVAINNAKSVRLLGSTNSNTGTNYASYAFWNSATYVDSSTVIEAHNWDVREGSTNYAKEYTLDVPNGATHIAVSLSSNTNQPNFYCYLRNGDSAVTQEQLSNVQQSVDEVRESVPLVESFTNKEANNVVLNKDIVKQLSLDEYDKIDVDMFNFNNGLPYSLNSRTLKFGTNASYKHVCIYTVGGDIIEVNGGEVDTYLYFLTSLELSNGGDIPIVAGTEPVLVKSGSNYILQAPIGTKCIAFYYKNSSGDIFIPQSLTIYRKKSDVYDRKVYNVDDYIMGNSLGGLEGTTTISTSYSRCFIIPIKAGFKYTLTLTNVGTAPKLFHYSNRLPNEGDSYDDILGFSNTGESKIATTFTPTYDGFFSISLRSTSYTADNISLVAIKSTIDMSDFVTPMLSKLKFNTPQYTVNSGGIYKSTYNRAGVFTTSRNYRHILLKVTAGDIVMLNKGDNPISYAYLKNETLVNNEFANFADGTAIMTSSTDVLEVVPPTTNYLYIQVSYNLTNYLPSYIGILADNTNAFTDDMQNRRDYNIAQAGSIGLSKLNVTIDENGWELPATLQQLNAQKKAEQLCKIKWTPKYNVPSKISPYYYDANIEQTSIPYSSNNDDGSKTIGEETSIHTFMTAVNNPFSLLYTECINNETRVANPTKASAWGKNYTKSGNGYAYYGTVCCGLTSSVENAPLKWNNPTIKDYLKTNGLYIQICPIGTVDFNLLQIGDVADNTVHSFLIYGLHRDANGNVDKVMISESSSGHGRGKCTIGTDNTREAFISRINRNGNNPFTLFRYVKLWNNTDYEPSEFVPLTDRGEIATEVVYNDAICTFAGDKATFRSDDLIVINYNLNGTQPYTWTTIKVYKDDVLLNEYTLSEAEATLNDFYTDKGEDTSVNGFNVISQHNHALVLGNQHDAGVYKACMSDGTNDSDFTYWEVIPNTITVVEQGYDSYKVNVDGGFLEAIYVGNAYYLPTYDEQATNEFIIHPIALMQAWRLSYDGIDVRVKLKGKYGSVTTVGATVIEGEVKPEPEPEPEPDDNN